MPKKEDIKAPSDDSLVSMNFWGLPGRIIDGLIKDKKATVKVIPCHEKWCGVTYKEDKEDVKRELQSKKDKGLYPEKLWK